MSSHHFVREGQEPALFILEDTGFDELKSLLEWSPFILVSAVVLEKVLARGIKIDAVLVQDIQSPFVRQLLHESPDTKLINFSNERDELISGMNFLIGHREKAVNIFCSGHLEVKDSLEPFIRKIGIVIFADRFRWFASPGKFAKWVPAGTRFQVSALEPINTTGLIDHQGFLQAAVDGMISIESQRPLWIGESQE
jgi:hypothetical protein